MFFRVAAMLDELRLLREELCCERSTQLHEVVATLTLMALNELVRAHCRCLRTPKALAASQVALGMRLRSPRARRPLWRLLTSFRSLVYPQQLPKLKAAASNHFGRQSDEVRNRHRSEIFAGPQSD